VPGPDEIDSDHLNFAMSVSDLPEDAEPAAEGMFADRLTIESYSRRWQQQPMQVRRYAQRILRDAGIERDVDARHTDQDMRAAAALGRHLQSTYTYTLDNPRSPDGRDPVLAFLFDTRRGHCELFAAGLTALCRSIGIPARVVVGFRASEYNAIGGYYVVRQSNAHAWTEVAGGPNVGWRTFDATPVAEVQAEHEVRGGFLGGLRSLYDHIEYSWIKTVVAFDQRTQQKVIEGAKQSLVAATGKSKNLGQWFTETYETIKSKISLDLLTTFAAGFVLFGLTVGVATLIRIYIVRRRRLVALKLDHLPRDHRRGLSRRLGFYLTMIDMLERHGYTRPDWQSPAEYAAELADSNPLRFDPVISLTELFYAIRFGQVPVDESMRHRIRTHLRQLEHAMGSPQYFPE
jgi:hypothetical protein